MRVEAWIEKLKKLFGTKSGVFIIIGILSGIVLLLIPSEAKVTESTNPDLEATASLDYCTALENKAEELILRLPEVKYCSVFITLETGFRYIYATDQHVYEESDSKQTDKTIVLADGTDGETAILVEETMPRIAGVAVVCEGASYETQRRIIDLICALFDIKSNRISVQT